MAHTRLCDPEYRNWVTVGRAIQITRNGLEAIVQNAVDKYHTSLLAALPNSVLVWKSHLSKAHRSTDKRKIIWSNSDNTLWLTAGASWEIAKIFMAPLGPRKLDVFNAKTTDISGLLNVLEWSPRGTNGMFNTGVVVSKIVNARSARNLWAHAPLLHVSDADKLDAFASLSSLLQDPELHHDKDVQHAIKELSSLLITGLSVIEEKELELFVQLQIQLGQDLVSLGNDMSFWKIQVKATTEQILEQKKSLQEFVKKNELQNALEMLVEKIKDLEDQLIHEFQVTNNRLDMLEENVSLESPQSCDNKSQLRFNEISDRMKEEFVGREWLFKEIHNWLEKDIGPRESRAFLIWGGAGTGKSSFTQEFVRRHKGKKLAGYHYCQKENPLTCDLESLALNLTSMLSEKLPEYAALVSKLQTNRFHNNPKALFDLLITTPLQQLNENSKHFLIIDGLDEGEHMIASCLARLSEKLPAWFRVIVTAKHNALAVSGLFLNCTSAKLDRSGINSQSHKDIREFVSMKYRKLQTEYNYIPSFFADDEQIGQEKIIQASQNCFLYAKLVLEDIFAGQDEIGLPSSLSEIYNLEFMNLFPDVEFFEKKIAPVLEIVLAINRANAFLFKDSILKDRLASRPDRLAVMRFFLQAFLDGFQQGNECVTEVVESGLLSSIRKRDLNKALKLLSGYLIRNNENNYHFIHNSVGDWLQDEKSNFFCDVLNGHSIMATYNLKYLKNKVPSRNDFVQDTPAYLNPEFTQYISKRSYSNALFQLKSFFIRYLFHCSFLPEHGASNVNVLLSELGIEAIDLLHVAFDQSDSSTCPTFVRSEYMAMEVLNKTDVLDKMSSKEKADHLEMAIKSNCASIIAKFFCSAHWVFSSDVIMVMTKKDMVQENLQFAQKNESLPQLFFSCICAKFNFLYFDVVVHFCLRHGIMFDICVPHFENRKPFSGLSLSIYWNEDVQEYFRKLKSGKKNVITLKSLREKPFYPEDARVSNFTLEIIQKPLSEIEHLVKNGEVVVMFIYAWHLLLMKNSGGRRLQMVEYSLEHGANPNNRGPCGVTALMLACKEQDDRLVMCLLKHKANVNQQDFFGRSALQFAIVKREPHAQVTLERFIQEIHIIEILLLHGADPYLKDCLGSSAVDKVIQRRLVVIERLMMRYAGQAPIQERHSGCKIV